MKRPLFSGYVFDPTVGTIDFTNTLGFDVRGVLGIGHIKSGTQIYSPIVDDIGLLSLTGAVMKLKASTVGMAANDPLLIMYQGPLVTIDATNTLTGGAAAVSVLPAHPSRQLLIISNTGGEPFSYRLGGGAPSATAGHPLSPGDEHRFEGPSTPTGELKLFATGNTSYQVTAG